jgi:hypothetical protein
MYPILRSLIVLIKLRRYAYEKSRTTCRAIVMTDFLTPLRWRSVAEANAFLFKNTSKSPVGEGFGAVYAVMK